MKKKVVCLFSALCFFSLSVFSQNEKKMQDEGVTVGSIVKDGKEVQGYIKVMGTTSMVGSGVEYAAPWQFESSISFIPKEVFDNNEKIKNKYYEKYSAKDIDGYFYGTDRKYYESVKFADMSQMGLSMIAKKMFMNKVKEGKITLYAYYENPPLIMDGSVVDQTYKECAKPKMVYKKGADGKLKLVADMSVEKELADCPLVTEKQKNGEYKVIGKDGKSSTFNKVLNFAIGKEEIRLMAIEDYNTKCN